MTESRIDIWANITGCFVLLGLMYYIVYYPNQQAYENTKMIIPLLCFCCGYIFHRALNELAGVK